MKHSEKFLNKMNDLLTMNNEVEKIYIEALTAVGDDELNFFFKERSSERREFARDLMLEIEKLNGGSELKFEGRLDKDFYVIWMNFRRLFLSENENELYEEVYKLKKLTIYKYNDLLSSLGLPLSTFRVLESQKENIIQTLNAIKREHAFVA